MFSSIGYTCSVLDSDQRRVVSVKGTGNFMDDIEKAEGIDAHVLKVIAEHMDDLPAHVRAITISDQDQIVSTSSDRTEDETADIDYPLLHELKPGEKTKLLLRTDLVETDRLSPKVDLAFYYGSPSQKRVVVFKYACTAGDMGDIWAEMNVWIRLPQGHPNIVPFDGLVLDEVLHRVVGFTSVYFPGGTLDKNKSRPFDLKHLKQLISLVDELNFKYGITHHDIAPRNLLFDEKNQIRLFDFGVARHFPQEPNNNFGDDIFGVFFTMYEIITGDDHYNLIPQVERKTSDVADLHEWKKHPDVVLDHPVSEYRKLLEEWRIRRSACSQLEATPEMLIRFPLAKVRSLRRIVKTLENGSKELGIVYHRREAEALGEASVHWERPAQAWLAPGELRLANGQPVPDNHPSRRRLPPPEVQEIPLEKLDALALYLKQNPSEDLYTTLLPCQKSDPAAEEEIDSKKPVVDSQEESDPHKGSPISQKRHAGTREDIEAAKYGVGTEEELELPAAFRASLKRRRSSAEETEAT